MYHPNGQQGRPNRRSKRGGGHGILGESPHLDRYSDESRFPGRSRGPDLNHGRYWNSNSYAPENNNPPEYYTPPTYYPPPEYYTTEYYHHYHAGFSESPTFNYHNPPMMHYAPRPSSSHIAQPNKTDRLQFGSLSYQVENRYAHTRDQFDWSRSQQATSGFTSFEDEQRNNTATEDFIQLEGYSKSTEVITINDPDNVEVEEGGAQNLSNSEDNPYDDPEDEDVVFICETVRSNELISRSTSQEHVELDAPAQPATPRASYNEVSVEYFYCHICHTHLDDAPSFTHHIDNEDHHQKMLNVLKEKNRIRAQFLRFEAYKLERVRSTESGSRVEQPHICRLCAIAYNGNEDEHRSCRVHRKLEVLLRPFCRICKLKFKSAIERESHRLTAEHLLAEEKADKIARADMDEVLEETNEDDLIESYLDQDPDVEAVKALYCRTCREYFAFKEDALLLHRHFRQH